MHQNTYIQSFYSTHSTWLFDKLFLFTLGWEMLQTTKETSNLYTYSLSLGDTP